jgi:hypothetical protein
MRIRLIRGRLTEPMQWKAFIMGSLFGVVAFVVLPLLGIPLWAQATVFGVAVPALGSLYQLRYDRYWDRRLHDHCDSWT